MQGLASLRVTGEGPKPGGGSRCSPRSRRTTLGRRCLTPVSALCFAHKALTYSELTKPGSFAVGKWNYKQVTNWANWSPLLSGLFTLEVSECALHMWAGYQAPPRTHWMGGPPGGQQCVPLQPPVTHVVSQQSSFQVTVTKKRKEKKNTGPCPIYHKFQISGFQIHEILLHKISQKRREIKKGRE